MALSLLVRAGLPGSPERARPRPRRCGSGVRTAPARSCRARPRYRAAAGSRRSGPAPPASRPARWAPSRGRWAHLARALPADFPTGPRHHEPPNRRGYGYKRGWGEQKANWDGVPTCPQVLPPPPSEGPSLAATSDRPFACAGPHVRFWVQDGNVVPSYRLPNLTQLGRSCWAANPCGFVSLLCGAEADPPWRAHQSKPRSANSALGVSPDTGLG